MFIISRIYNDSNNDSRFGELRIPLSDKGNIGLLSNEIAVKSIVFREVMPDYDWEFHTAPQRQFIILLDGAIEIETSSGEKKQFKAGDIILVEDTEGKGHRTKNLIAAKRKSVFITLP